MYGTAKRREWVVAAPHTEANSPGMNSWNLNKVRRTAYVARGELVAAGHSIAVGSAQELAKRALQYLHQNDQRNSM